MFANNLDHLIDYLDVDNTVGIVPKIHIEQMDSSLLSEYVVSAFGDKKYERGFLMLRTNSIKSNLNRV